jgi:hypothetical protein
MIVAPMDPRVRMRDALRELVQENPTSWDQPSLFVLRNRLLDRTGSDARPLAELLIEALRRGWRDRLPPGAVDPARWHTLTSSFVLQWSTERFVQPEMARWALESWGYAMRVIDASQITIAPPPKREPIAAMAARLNSRAAQAGAQAARAVAQATAAGARLGTPAAGSSSTAARVRPAAAPGGRTTARSAPRGTVTLPPRATGAYGPRGRATAPSVSPWIPRALAGTLLAMALLVIGRVAFFSRPAGAEPTPAQIAEAGVDPATRGDSIARARARDALIDQAISPAARALRTPVTSVEVSTQLPTSIPTAMLPSTRPSTRPPTPSSTTVPPTTGLPTAVALATGDSRRGAVVSPSLTGGIAIIAADRPGVPSITRSVLPTTADSARMIFVQPARRAAGESRVVASPTAKVALTYDELRLLNGTVLRGRVDVVQAGSVIFRDGRSGLRYEIRKDEIDQIISEFGTPVRFRAGAADVGAAAAARPLVKTNGVRDRGVAGRYRIRYATAAAIGSRECTQVWNKPPNTEDVAIVRHAAGADTLNVAFDGGDNFPSNVDGDGYFASTFRIVPDQARTMTALTTRLNGQFLPDGTMRFAVNIVFYRRMRSGGDITCNVAINAEGRRF